MFHLTNGCFETQDLASHPSWVLGLWMPLVLGTSRPYVDHWRSMERSSEEIYGLKLMITSICSNFFPESCYPRKALRLELRKYHLSIVQLKEFHTPSIMVFHGSSADVSSFRKPGTPRTGKHRRFSTFKAGHTRLVQRVGADAKPWAEGRVEQGGGGWWIWCFHSKHRVQ